jgi:hypothetical protein
MRGHGQKFTRKQEQAIIALLACESLEMAARQVGIHLSTLKRWMEEPLFDRRYRAARRDVLHGAQVLLLQAGSTAVRTLTTVMDNAEEPATARVSAARCVLEMLLKTFAQETLEARVSELEQLKKPAGRTNGQPFTTYS